MELKGFILRSKLLGNKLKIITAYTDKLGKVDFIAKTKRGDFPLKLDLFSLSRFLVLQKGEKWELQEAFLVRHHFPQSLEQFYYLSRISKLLIFRELPRNEKLFKLIDNYFLVEDSFELAYTMFLLKFSFIEGIFPALTKCIDCGNSRIVIFSFSKGGVLCQKCKNKSEEIVPWNVFLSKLSIRLAKEPFSKVKNEKISLRNLYVINTVFEKHLRLRL
ncbi:MAG: DNA repair protein RecO [Desulfurobacteriaceae bacterium]